MYFDLDTVILNNIDSYIKKIKDSFFSCLPHRATPSSTKIHTGIMYWKHDVSFIYEEWLKLLTFSEEISTISDSSKFRQYIKLIFRDISDISINGDQDVVRYIINKTNTKWDPLPLISKSNDISGPIVSYKVIRPFLEKNSTQSGKNFINTKKIVYFHGLPRPWEQTIIPY